MDIKEVEPFLGLKCEVSVQLGAISETYICIVKQILANTITGELVISLCDDNDRCLTVPINRILAISQLNED